MFIRAVAEHPDDVQRRLVLADALQLEGDPWGDLVALQHRIDAFADGSFDDYVALLDAERQLTTDKATEIFGALQRHLPSCFGGQGHVSVCLRHGLIHTATVAIAHRHRDDALMALLTHSLAQSLACLRLDDGMAPGSASMRARLRLRLVHMRVGVPARWWPHCLERLWDWAPPRPGLRIELQVSAARRDHVRRAARDAGSIGNPWAPLFSKAAGRDDC